MRRAIWQILAGFALACITAALLALIIDRSSGALALNGLIPRLLLSALDLAVWAFPGAIIAICISEWLGLRSALYHLLAGAAVALLGVALKYGGVPVGLISGTGTGWRAPILTMGVLGGLAYWGMRGRFAGHGFAHHAPGGAGDDDRRCWPCVLGALGAAVLPLFLVSCWGLNEANVISRITAEAEKTGNAALSESGFKWASLKIDDAVGRVTGQAPDEEQKSAAFAKAHEVLRPMIGLPGVVSVLENAITVENSAKADEALLKSLEDSKLAAELEARRRAEEEARLKAAADEAERKAADEKRLADEAETKRKADLALLAEEARKADEERRAAVAAEDARRAADDEARKRDEEKRLATLEAEKAATSQAEHQRQIIYEPFPWPVVQEPPKVVAAPPSAEPTAEKKNSCRADFAAMLSKEKLEFNVNSADLSPQSAELIDKLATAGKSCAGVKVRIDGHTDAQGKAVANLKLSQRRADAVKDALVARGVTAADLTTQGFGEDKPLDIRETREALARNRRIEFTVLDSTSKAPN